MVTGCRLVVHIAGRVPSEGVVVFLLESTLVEVLLLEVSVVYPYILPWFLPGSHKGIIGFCKVSQ